MLLQSSNFILQNNFDTNSFKTKYEISKKTMTLDNLINIAVDTSMTQLDSNMVNNCLNLHVSEMIFVKTTRI